MKIIFNHSILPVLIKRSYERKRRTKIVWRGLYQQNAVPIIDVTRVFIEGKYRYFLVCVFFIISFYNFGEPSILKRTRKKYTNHNKKSTNKFVF